LAGLTQQLSSARRSSSQKPAEECRRIIRNAADQLRSQLSGVFQAAAVGSGQTE
jgi:hypothetical protein